GFAGQCGILAFERLSPCLTFVDRKLQFRLLGIRNSLGFHCIGLHSVLPSDVKRDLLASSRESFANGRKVAREHLSSCLTFFDGLLPFLLRVIRDSLGFHAVGFQGLFTSNVKHDLFASSSKLAGDSSCLVPLSVSL